MKTKNQRSWGARIAGILPAAALLAFLTVPAQAGVIISISPGTVTAAAPSTNNFFDVLLTLDTAATLDIAGFSFGVNSASTDVNFTGVLSTAPNYVFGASSLFGPNIDTTTGSSVVASDLYSGSGNITLAGNSSYSLGRVFFDVSPTSAYGTFTLTLDTLATSLSDSNGNAVGITTLTGGNLDIATPEPGSAALFLLGLPALAFLRKRR